MLPKLGKWFLALEAFKERCLASYYLNQFWSCGTDLEIEFPFSVQHAELISLGNGVRIRLGSQLKAISKNGEINKFPKIQIANNCLINRGTRIVSANRIEIGENTMIAPYCYIADNEHQYEDVSKSIGENPLKIGEISIGADSWIGTFTCIYSNVKIGNHVVVGAHSIVRQDIPDYCVAVGIPAKVVKRYDPEKKLFVTSEKKSRPSVDSS